MAFSNSNTLFMRGNPFLIKAIQRPKPTCFILFIGFVSVVFACMLSVLHMIDHNDYSMWYEEMLHVGSVTVIMMFITAICCLYDYFNY